MIWFLFCVSFSSLYSFHDDILRQGEVLQRFFDTSPGIVRLNISVTQCVGDCRIEIFAYEELRKQQVFPKEIDYQAVCCANESKCSVGSIYFADSSPVIRRPIVFKAPKSDGSPENDIVLDKTSTLASIDMSQFVSQDIDLPRKGLWTIMLANCGNNNVTIGGNASVARKIGYLDDRLHSFSIFAIVQLLFGASYMAYFITTVWKTQPRLSADHYLLISSIACYLADSAMTIVFFIKMNSSCDVHLIYTIGHSIVRANCIVFGLYTSLTILQRPIEIPLYIYAIAIIPMVFVSFVEDEAIVGFSKLVTGKWYFGYSKYSLYAFIYSVVISGSAAYVSYTRKPSESSHSEKRHRLLSYFVGSIIAYVCMNILLFLFRIRSTIFGTRKSEWVTWTIIPVFLSSLIVTNGWFLLDINTEGWEVLDSAPEDL